MRSTKTNFFSWETWQQILGKERSHPNIIAAILFAVVTVGIPMIIAGTTPEFYQLLGAQDDILDTSRGNRGGVYLLLIALYPVARLYPIKVAPQLFSWLVFLFGFGSMYFLGGESIFQAYGFSGLLQFVAIIGVAALFLVALSIKGIFNSSAGPSRFVAVLFTFVVGSGLGASYGYALTSLIYRPADIFVIDSLSDRLFPSIVVLVLTSSLLFQFKEIFQNKSQ